MKHNIKNYAVLGFMLNMIGQASQAQIDTACIRSYNSTTGFYKLKQNLFQAGTTTLKESSITFQAGLSLALDRTDVDALGKHFRYHHVYNGRPVVNSDFFIHTDGDNTTLMANGILLSGISAAADAGITPAQAIDAAIAADGASQYAWDNQQLKDLLRAQLGDDKATYYPSPQLVVVKDPGTMEYKLSYKVTLTAASPQKYVKDYYINAIGGAVVHTNMMSRYCSGEAKHASSTALAPPPPCAAANCQGGTANTLFYGTMPIYTNRSNNPSTNVCMWVLNDFCNTTHLSSVDQAQPGGYTWNSGNTWGTNSQVATTAFFALESAEEYYRNVHGRNSYDNLSGAMSTMVNDPAPSTAGNAQWFGWGVMFIGVTGGPFSNPLVGVDVIGHEMTHGISSAVGLPVTGEEGAVGEALSDIFGTMIGHRAAIANGFGYDWQYGNECLTGGMRNMGNPNATSQPDTYMGTNWAAMGGPNVGIHTNCTVIDYMYYLLVNGGTGTNDLGNPYCVHGITSMHAEQVIYRAMTVYLQSTTNFIGFRAACEQAAADLYGGNSYVDAELGAAFYAVGIGGPYTGTYNIWARDIYGTESFNRNCRVAIVDSWFRNGSNVTVTSNTEIRVSNDLDIFTGATFAAYIAPACSGGARMANGEATTTDYGDIAGIATEESVNTVMGYDVMPNPSSGNFKLVIKNASEYPSSVSVMDLLGKEVLVNKDPKSYEVDFDLSTAAPGMYFVKIIYQGNTLSKRIIKN